MDTKVDNFSEMSSILSVKSSLGTEYHDRILSLMQANMGEVAKRLTA
jgi:hypothetical protein